MNRRKKVGKSAFVSRLPDKTDIEVVAIKGSQVIVTKMTYGDFLRANKKKGWIYTPYQLGFSKFKQS